MNSMIVRWTIVALGISAVPTVLTAQTTTTAEEKPMAIKVIPVRHVEPGAVEQVVMQLDLGDFYMVANVNPPQVVIQGDAQAIQAVERLVAELDVAPEEEVETQTEFIPVASYSLDELVGLLYSSYGRGRVRVGIDELNHRLVVTDTPEMIHRIRSFVNQVDRPERSLTLNFFFIRGRIAAQGGTRDGELPEPLLPIAETLMANGFGDLSLMAPVIVQAGDGEAFESEAVLQLEAEDGTPEILSFSVGGRVIADAEADQVRLTVEAKMHGVPLTKHDLRAGVTRFDLSTTLATDMGRYVVLAAAPSSTADGDLMALVVRVMPEQ